MRQPVLISLLALFASTSQNFEETSPSAWLDDCYAEELYSEPTKDNQTGCICRFKLRTACFVCYGGGKCPVFPRNQTLPPGTVDFRLRTSNIKSVVPQDLIKFTILKVLVIDANNRLDYIAGGTFSNLVDLKFLSISFNRELKTLEKNTFEGLLNLQVLRLVKNGFTNILDPAQALQSNYLHNLKTLSLNENSFPEIDDTSFEYLEGTSISELELTSCEIKKITNNSLSVFAKLQILRIGDNLIGVEDLGNLLDHLESIHYLNLYNSGLRRDEKLTELLKKLSNLNVSHLNLSRNHIESISADLFPPMPKLEVLDLREVSAIKVDKDALNQDLLPNLKTLLLAGNKLPGMLPGVLLPQLTHLDLSKNSESYFDVSANNRNGVLNLTFIDLSYNRLSRVSQTTFFHFDHLEVLKLNNATIYYISNQSFLSLRNLKTLNLDNNPYEPFNLFNSSIFDGLINLETLSLGRCKIASFYNVFIFRNLSSLKNLFLQGNLLVNLEPHLLVPLGSLVKIDLSANSIEPWSASPRFENNQNLTTVILTNNKLSKITVPMMQDFLNLSLLEISGNDFFCDCSVFAPAMGWIRGRGLRYNDTPIATSDQFCSSPENWQHKSMADFLESTDHCDFDGIFTPVYVSLALLALFWMCLGVLAYYYRWHVRYWAFLARMAFLRVHGWMLKKNKVHPGDYKYDAFVSYSHEDRSFIVRLVAMLEEQDPFLKLCVYERDFEIGTVISETVMEKVEMSRRTLLIVSNSFAQSQWCLWELQLAEYHRLPLRKGFRDDPLVIIKLGPIAPCNLTPTLKYLLKSRIYLEWNPDKQISFWAKLRATLAPDNEYSLSSNSKV